MGRGRADSEQERNFDEEDDKGRYPISTDRLDLNRHYNARAVGLDLQAQNAEGDNDQVEDEDIGNAEGKAEDHGQYSEPVSERSRVS